jgi:hypothetical protein
MKQTDDRLKLSQPARYQIQVQGRLDDAWTDHFTGMTLSTQGEGAVTTLEGTAPDQAALFGILLHLRDLGLPLRLVRWIEEG